MTVQRSQRTEVRDSPGPEASGSLFIQTFLRFQESATSPLCLKELELDLSPVTMQLDTMPFYSKQLTWVEMTGYRKRAKDSKCPQET